MVVNHKAHRCSSTIKTATIPNGDAYNQAEYQTKEARTRLSRALCKASLKKSGKLLITLLVCASSILASFPMLKRSNYSFMDQHQLGRLDYPVLTTTTTTTSETERVSLNLQRVNENNGTDGTNGDDNRADVGSQRNSSNSKIKHHPYKKNLQLQSSSTTSSNISSSKATKPNESPTKTTKAFASTISNINDTSAANNNVTKDGQFLHAMRACIMVRNDNHLLAEWIAYHYTVLPLRYLIVASDDNATDDPHDVLKHWEGTDLNYEIWHSDNYTQNLTYDDWRPLNRFRQRQPYFLGKCMEHFHNQGNLGWVAMIDTDEYIKLNPLDDYLNDKLYVQNKTPSQLGQYIVNNTARFMAENETLEDRIAMRKKIRQRLGLEKGNNTTTNQLSIQTKIPTVLDVLDEYTAQHNTLPCHSFSRLRYGAVMDNLTELSATLCTPKLNPEVQSSMNATARLSTIRFLYHAAPLQFTHNEWTKTVIDLRRIPYESLSDAFNPHRPLRRECQGTYIHDMASFIHANHYANERTKFTRQGDIRRGQDKVWETVGHLRDGVRCDQIHGWLNEFVQQFGAERAKQMLAL